MELKIDKTEKPRTSATSTDATYADAAPIPGIGKYLFNGMVVTLNGVPVESHSNTLHMRNYINLTFFKSKSEKENVLKPMIYYGEYATVHDMDAHKKDATTPYNELLTTAEKEHMFRVFDRLDIELGRSNKYMIPGVRVSVKNYKKTLAVSFNRSVLRSVIKRMLSESKRQLRRRNHLDWKF